VGIKKKEGTDDNQSVGGPDIAFSFPSLYPLANTRLRPLLWLNPQARMHGSDTEKVRSLI
jgi:hypothetical protein